MRLFGIKITLNDRTPKYDRSACPNCKRSRSYDTYDSGTCDHCEFDGPAEELAALRASASTVDQAWADYIETGSTDRLSDLGIYTDGEAPGRYVAGIWMPGISPEEQAREEATWHLREARKDYA